MRSKLFVPGARPDFFQKALASEADALSFDLEDAVPEEGKASARARLASFLASDEVRASTKTIIVRVNAPSTPFFRPDLEMLADVRIDLINLPKIEEVDVMNAAAELATRVAPAQLLVNVETPRALARAAAIASAHPAIAGLQAGLNDLFAPLGIERADPANVRVALWPIRIAAAEAGLFAYDGAWPDVSDPDGFCREAKLARGMGFMGKSCVHPCQVAIANRVFESGDALAQARRLVAAAQTAAAQGRGAFLLDGRMIDRPEIAQAEALLAGAEAGR